MKYDLCIIGGCGHIGAPLSILFASKGYRVLILDPNKDAWDIIKTGKLPFLENGHEPLLEKALANNNLYYSNNVADIQFTNILIITIGTPIDEFFNPKVNEIIKCIDGLPLTNNHLLILRSTLFPGTTDYVSKYLKNKELNPLIAFCPERILQGEAINELQKLPQIVSGTSQDATNAAISLFKTIAPKIIEMKPSEAEFAKLIANNFRYIQFAAANQFYEIATAAGLNYDTIMNGVKEDYPRMAGLPNPGMSAGPCLLKDTMQLYAFSNGKFQLGHAALQANEGLPAFLVSQLEKEFDLSEQTIGLLGMAFKKDSDDNRTSLSYKLKKILQIKAKNVLTTDPLVNDKNLLPLNEVIEKSDILIICVPHSAYDGLDFGNKKVVNVWGK
jgi:UDP-N-acetyl-D-mannosaminuronic acid dehydrogenase